MSILLNEIFEWAEASLLYWEQLALDKIITHQTLTAADCKECLSYLLQDKELEPLSSVSRPKISFLQNISTDMVQEKAKNRLYLQSIYNLTNVNALVSNQNITFSKRLTVIYGTNGSGKSGYARVLGRAGFTRGDQEILRDVLQPVDADNPPSAKIELVDENDNKIIIDFNGDSISDMRCFYMFDSTSIDAHLKNQNELSFSPTGLMYLKFLAEETDKIRSLLTAEIERRKAQPSPQVMWDGESEVTRLTTDLDARTDLEALRRLTELTEEDNNRIVSLRNEIVQLQNTEPAVNRLKQEREDIQKLQQDRISTIEEIFSTESIASMNNVINEYHSITKTIEHYNLEDMKHSQLNEIGTPIWHEFTRAAYDLAQKEGINYPQPDDVCLLCQQPLQDEAQNYINRLWKFLQLGAQVEYQDTQAKINSFIEIIVKLDLTFLEEESIYYRYLSEKNPNVLKKLTSYINQAQSYTQHTLAKLKEHQTIRLDGLLPISSILDAIILEIDNELSRLTDLDAVEENLNRLLNEKRSLEHRQLLKNNLPQIEDYVAICQWIENAEKAGGDTKKITRKHNELFTQHVTQKFLELFEDMLAKLGRPLQVKIETKGKKGQTFKQIVLRSKSSEIKSDIKPDQVLSEGEKRAVAFADFMTEVALDPNCTGIILDDPVTSLDLEWRNTIANILVEETKNRQVIIFTHDSPFLYLLKTSSQEKVDCMIHWIVRGKADGKPGYVHLNNAPILEQDYKNAQRAEEFYKAAKSEQIPDKHQELLQSGIDALRTSYEALVVFGLLNGVVQRYSDRLSIGSLEKIVWDKEIVEKIISNYENLSRYIKGHLHPDNSPHQPLNLSLLRHQIDNFNELKKRITKLKS